MIILSLLFFKQLPNVQLQMDKALLLSKYSDFAKVSAPEINEVLYQKMIK